MFDASWATTSKDLLQDFYFNIAYQWRLIESLKQTIINHAIEARQWFKFYHGWKMLRDKISGMYDEAKGSATWNDRVTYTKWEKFIEDLENPENLHDIRIKKYLTKRAEKSPILIEAIMNGTVSDRNKIMEAIISMIAIEDLHDEILNVFLKEGRTTDSLLTEHEIVKLRHDVLMAESRFSFIVESIVYNRILTKEKTLNPSTSKVLAAYETDEQFNEVIMDLHSMGNLEHHKLKWNLGLNPFKMRLWITQKNWQLT